MSDTPETDDNCLDSHLLPVTSAQVAENRANIQAGAGGYATYVDSWFAERLERKLLITKAALAAERKDGERYRQVRTIALNGNYADLRAIISSDSDSAFDAKVDILQDAAIADSSAKGDKNG